MRRNPLNSRLPRNVCYTRYGNVCCLFQLHGTGRNCVMTSDDLKARMVRPRIGLLPSGHLMYWDQFVGSDGSGPPEQPMPALFTQPYWYAEDGFQARAKELQHAIDNDLIYTPCLHPWSIYRFDPELEHLDRLIEMAKENDVPVLSAMQLYEECRADADSNPATHNIKTE